MLTYRPRVIPTLLLNEGNLVKTIKFKDPNYLGDPINAVKIFNEKEVDELCLLDISASREGRPIDFELLKDIASEAFMPLSYGGGIKTVDEIHRLFKIGFEKVVINSSFIDNPELVREASRLSGCQSIVVSIDVKKQFTGKYISYTHGGTKKSGKEAKDLAKFAEECGAGEIIINSIDRDGMMQGYDTKLIREVAEAVSVPVVACGGAGGLSDLKLALTEGKAHAVTAGSMFVYYGRKKAVLINFPTEEEFIKEGIYR